jgi:hypothetical protein
MPDLSNNWRCPEGHQMGQCYCNLDVFYQNHVSSQHYQLHVDAVEYYMAFIDWFVEGTPNLGVSYLLEKAKKHLDMMKQLR